MADRIQFVSTFIYSEAMIGLQKSAQAIVDLFSRPVCVVRSIIGFLNNAITNLFVGKINKRFSAQTLFLIVFATFLTGCGNSNLKWYVVSPATEQGRINLKFLISGTKDTLLMSLLALFISIVVGLLIAIPGIARQKPVRATNIVYVELVRSIPLLPLILWVYYGLPEIAGVQLDYFWAGVFALALSDSAFEAEIFRAGIQSIPRGQSEAASTVGLNYRQTMRYVVLPQAIRRILPALGNQFAYMVKMSALVSVIGLQELTRRANELIVTEYRALEIYTILIIEYLVIILIIGQGVRWLERKMGSDESNAGH